MQERTGLHERRGIRKASSCILYFGMRRLSRILVASFVAILVSGAVPAMAAVALCAMTCCTSSDAPAIAVNDGCCVAICAQDENAGDANETASAPSPVKIDHGDDAVAVATVQAFTDRIESPPLPAPSGRTRLSLISTLLI